MIVLVLAFVVIYFLLPSVFITGALLSSDWSFLLKPESHCTRLFSQNPPNNPLYFAPHVCAP